MTEVLNYTAKVLTVENEKVWMSPAISEIKSMEDGIIHSKDVLRKILAQ
ncbi:MAG: hypothetical protein HGA49_09260 [Eubacteriaceae bacterium]|nr:hypothetical protein [Eubacteriaceae bacterium]